MTSRRSRLGIAAVVALAAGGAWFSPGGSSARPAASAAARSHAPLANRVAGGVVDPVAAPAPRPDPSYPVGVELCLPSEHYKPASPPVTAGVNPAAVGEALRARLHVADAVEQDLSVRWRGDEAQPFEAVFEFYLRGDWATFLHSCTFLQDAAGRWSLIDYTVQKVSPREDEPVRVLTERSPEWRALERRMTAR